jgi:hypothetical protein
VPFPPMWVILLSTLKMTILKSLLMSCDRRKYRRVQEAILDHNKYIILETDSEK